MVIATATETACIVRRVRSLVVLFFILLLFSLILRAQSPNAFLTRRVANSSKARIVGAKVTAISAGTNIRDEVTSNASGEHCLPNLAPGIYRI